MKEQCMEKEKNMELESVEKQYFAEERSKIGPFFPVLTNGVLSKIADNLR